MARLKLPDLQLDVPNEEVDLRHEIELLKKKMKYLYITNIVGTVILVLIKFI